MGLFLGKSRPRPCNESGGRRQGHGELDRFLAGGGAVTGNCPRERLSRRGFAQTRVCSDSQHQSGAETERRPCWGRADGRQSQTHAASRVRGGLLRKEWRGRNGRVLWQVYFLRRGEGSRESLTDPTAPSSLSHVLPACWVFREPAPGLRGPSWLPTALTAHNLSLNPPSCQHPPKHRSHSFLPSIHTVEVC